MVILRKKPGEMVKDQDIISDAIHFLKDGLELEAANVLRTCTIENIEPVDFWMDGSRQLDGLLIEVTCPRTTYEIIEQEAHPIRKSIDNAIRAVLPRDSYLKSLRARAVPGEASVAQVKATRASEETIGNLLNELELQKSLMIAVATGGPRINDVNKEYQERRARISESISLLDLEDPSPFPDLWAWYGKWSNGSLPTYQSRRLYISALFQPLIDGLHQSRGSGLQIPEPTGWARVDRNVDKIGKAIEQAKNEEDFQTLGLLCREAIISLAQAVYDPEQHASSNGIRPSEADAKRMLEAYIVNKLSGQSSEYHRKFARASFDLAVSLQHCRTASFRDAALCVEATRSVINTIAIISGQRDPD